MKVTTIGIDISKSVFQIHGVDERGKEVIKRRVKRSKFLETMAQVPPSLIGIEACGSAHHWARELTKLGHDVRLMHPKFVKAYAMSDKTDAKDAATICEAVSRPRMNFVAIKTTEQQAMQGLHRVRERLMKSRTALSNQTRGVLAEFGFVCPKGIAHLRGLLANILGEEDTGIPGIMMDTFRDAQQEFQELDEKIAHMDQRIKMASEKDEACQRIMALDGVGPMIATAIVAMVGDARIFKNGRQFAAYLGLVPKEHSSGGRKITMGISKRGNRYIRALMIHGARSAVHLAKKKTDPTSQWVNALRQRSHANIAAVALANKNARVIWALLSKGETLCSSDCAAGAGQ